jgi:uncharacterized protein YbjT (DUF2867 family)
MDKYLTVKINVIARNPFKAPVKFSSNSNITIFEADSSDKAVVTKALKGSLTIALLKMNGSLNKA